MSSIIKGLLNEGNLPPRAGFNKKPVQKGPGTSKDDYEYTEFTPRGKEDREAWAVKRTVDKQKLAPKKPKELDTGFYSSYLGNRPFREGSLSEALDNLYAQKKDGFTDEDKVLFHYLKSPMFKTNAQGEDWIYAAQDWLETVKKDLQKKYPNLDLSDLNDFAHRMYEDYLARKGQLEETHSTGTTIGSAGIGGGSGIGTEASPIVQAFQNQIDETIQSSQGGMGQAYRKISVKGPAGMSENMLATYGDQFGFAKESSIMKGIQSEGEAGTRQEWSKANPPPPELLLNTLIQILMRPDNKSSPEDLINLWNQKYGLKHTLRTLKAYAQNDYKKAELSKALTQAAMVHESFKGK